MWASVGPRERERVGLVIEDPAAMCRVFLSALAAGVTVAPLSPATTDDELAGHTDALRLTALVTDRADTALGAAAADPAPAVYLLARDGLAKMAAGERAALILPTSGSSGRAKLVPLTEPQLLYVAGAVARHHGLQRGERGYSPLPLFHINGLVVGVLSALVSGASLVLDERFSAGTFWDAVAEHKVTWVNMVPAVLFLDTSTAHLRGYHHYPVTLIPALAELVHEHYRPIALVEGVTVYKLNPVG